MPSAFWRPTILEIPDLVLAEGSAFPAARLIAHEPAPSARGADVEQQPGHALDAVVACAFRR